MQEVNTINSYKSFIYLITLGKNDEYKIEFYPAQPVGGLGTSTDDDAALDKRAREKWADSADLPRWRAKREFSLTAFTASQDKVDALLMRTRLGLLWTAIEVRSGGSVVLSELCRRLRAEEGLQ